MKKRKTIGMIKIVTIVSFLLIIGSITWIVHGNDKSHIAYTIQEQVSKDETTSTLTLMIDPSAAVVEVEKVEMPDGSIIEKDNNITYTVSKNDDYIFVVYYKIQVEAENGEYQEIEQQEEIVYTVATIQEEIQESQDFENDDATIIQEAPVIQEPPSIEENTEGIIEQNEKAPELYADYIVINEVTFKDSNLRNKLLNDASFIKGYGNDGKLTQAELNSVTSLQMGGFNISDFTGLERFTKVELLNLNDNNLKTISLNCFPNLKKVSCVRNNATRIDVSGCPELISLVCFSNNLTSLDISHNPKLQRLHCQQNKIIYIDASNNPNLVDGNLDGQPAISCGEQTINISMYLCSDRKWRNNPLEIYNISSIPGTGVQLSYNSKKGQFTSSSKNNTSSTFTSNSKYTTGKNLTVSGTINFAYIDDGIIIDETNFPDANFRNYLLTDETSDQIKGYGKDGLFTNSEISNIIIMIMGGKKISSIEGIAYFKELQYLYCYVNSLTSVDISKNAKIKDFRCQNNKLVELDVSNKNSLEILYCGNNVLETLHLPENNTVLKLLDCSKNKLATLDVRQYVNLDKLYCGNNQLMELNLTKNTQLSILSCEANHILSLDLSKNEKLTNATGTLQTRNIIMTNYEDTWKSDPLCDYVISNILNTNITYDNEAKQFISSSTSNVTSQFNTKCNIGTGNVVLTLSGTLSFEYGVEINKTNFPDTNFRNYLLMDETVDQINGYGKDKFLSASELNSIRKIYVNGKSISNLEGIKFFNALQTLYCYSNTLTSIDVTRNKELVDFRCQNNDLTTLDVKANTKLENLFCDSNKLSTLDVSKNMQLKMVNCSDNKLSILDIENHIYLTNLYCNNNPITQLKIQGNTALSILNVENCKLASINVSDSKELKDFNCNDNQLTKLDVTENKKLTGLYCRNNKIMELNLDNNLELVGLNVYGNQIVHLNVLSTKIVSLNGGKQTRKIPMYYSRGVWKSDKKIDYEITSIGNNKITYDSTSGQFSSSSNTNTSSTFSTTCKGINGEFTLNGDLTFSYNLDPTVWVLIPANIQLNRIKDNDMFEAEKEAEIKILDSTNLTSYNETFFVKTDPRFHLLNTEDQDEWFTVQVYDENSKKHASKDSPLAVLNSEKRSQKFYIMAYKDIARKRGIYKGTMNFIIEYGDES